MKQFLIFICTFAYLHICTSAFAQTNKEELTTEDVEVIKDYQPMLADAVKINFPPQVPVWDSKQSKMKYYLPKKQMTLSYLPPPIKPLAMSTKETDTDLPKASLKTGYGNYSTIFIDAMYNSGRSEWFNWGANYKHLSSKSKSLEAQNFSENNLELFGKYFFNTVIFKSNIRASRDVIYFYGNPGVKKSKRLSDIDSLQQYFYFANYTGELSNYESNGLRIDWKMQFKFDYLLNKNDASEWSPFVNINLSKLFDNKNELSLNFKYDYTDYNDNIAAYIVLGNFPTTIPQYDYKRTITSIHPKFKFIKDIFTLYAGLDLTFEKDERNDNTYLFPDITTETKLLGDKLIFYNGWHRFIQKNSFKSLTDENPFLSQSIQIINSKTEDRFAGARGGFMKNFTYNLKFSQKIVNDLPLFFNDTMDLNKFKIAYDDKTQIINLLGEISYQQTEQFRVKFGGEYFIYELSEEEKAWHLPSYSLNLSGSYLAWKKILLTTDIFFEGGIFARAKDGTLYSLKDLTDLNFSVNYFFSKKLTFFVMFNNVMRKKHYRWMRYPSYKENGLIGLKVIF